MKTLNIYSSNTSQLYSGLELVYSGKSGYTAELGVIDCLCTSQTVLFNTVQLQVANLHLIHSEIIQTGLENNANTYIRVPITQLQTPTYLEGSTGFIDNDCYASLEVLSSNITSNTITVADYTTSQNTKISAALFQPPYRLRLYQPTIQSDVAYVSGVTKPVTQIYNVANITGNYTATHRISARLRSDISVFLDDIEVTNFTWPVNGNSNQVQVPVSSGDSQLRIKIYMDTVPAFETNDSAVLSVYNNNYTISNTSYYVGDSMYSSAHTTNGFYKVQLNKNLPIISSSIKIINTSTDLVGKVSNITANSFTISYDDSYPFRYNLANNKIYAMYPKNKVTLVNARLDEYGRATNMATGTYLVTATNLNSYNRTSPTVTDLIDIEPLKLSKVSSVDVSESIVIDTTSGATINATISFPPIIGRDIQNYEVKYRVLSNEVSVSPEFSSLLVAQNTSADFLRASITNLTRGRYSGSNTLDLRITPLNSTYRGFITTHTHSLIGKTAKPSGLQNLSVAQQDTNLLFSWQFQLTSDGFILDLDTKEVEIREYHGAIDISNQSTVNATWSLAVPVSRISFPSTTYSMPVSKFGEYTYLFRVRDTSNINSDRIAAATLVIVKPANIKTFKAYNESRPNTAFVTQYGEIMYNSNVNPEESFTSFSEGITGGLILYNSSNTDNSNGSAEGFSVYSNTNFLTTGSSTISTYITPIRDVGAIIDGTIRIDPTISITNPGFTYNSQYSVVFSGITDYHPSAGLPVSSNVLVDNAFGGIGHILGFNNTQAATVSYNTFHKTLTSGGPYGNVFAIRSTGTGPNADVIAKIAGVINENAIALGEVYYSNGFSTLSNNLANVAIAGNSYELVDLYQFADPRSSFTFLGPESSIVQNIFVRVSSSNVFYGAAANGIVGYPYHGNTNPNAFYGASSNASLGWKSYVPGQYNFRYFQIKLEYINKAAGTTEVLLENFKYQVDVQERQLLKDITITSVAGELIDYSFMNYVEVPKITATITGTGSFVPVIANKNISNCTVQVYDSQDGNLVDFAHVSVSIVGV